MSFLLLNGWALPARIDAGGESTTPWGASGVAWDNNPLATRRGLPQEWKATLAVMGKDDVLDADTVECLLAGKGHHFRLDEHAFSSQGLGPEIGGAVTFPQRTSAGGMVGTGYLSVTDTILWDTGLDDVWTVAYWRNVTTTPQHVVVRSDGAKWLDGVRADATVTTELVVDAGAVGFVGPVTLDDLVVMPVEMSAAAVVALYRLQAGKGLRVRHTFDGHVDDEAQRMGLTSVATAFGAPTYVRGVVGNAIRSVAGDSVVDTGTAPRVVGQTEMSIECWVRFVTGLARSNPAVITARTVNGYLLQTVSDTDLRLDAKLQTATLLHSRTDAALTPDVWHHVVVTWAQASGALVIYVDGVAASSTVVTNPGSAPTSDAAAGSLNVAGVGGDVDELRFYERALTAAEVVDHYSAGARGVAAPVIQAAPDFPVLKLDGGCVGWRPRAVLGNADEDQDHIAHGGTGGWATASRDVPVILTEVEDAPPPALPEPWVGWVLSEAQERAAAQVTPAYGSVFGAGARTGSYGPGAFRAGRGLVFGAAGSVAVPAGVVSAMAGKSAFTVMAFVQRDLSGVQHTVLDLGLTGVASKLRLDVTAANVLRLAVRPSSAEAVQTASMAGTLVGGSEWHAVAATVDLPTDTVTLTVDGTRETFTGLGWTAQAFTAEQAGPHAIGLDLSGANRWDGSISHVFLWPKALTAGEVAEAVSIWKGVRHAAF